MKEIILKEVKNALTILKDTDSDIFNCPIEEDSDDNARKLHEVCINHRFSNHLEKCLSKKLEDIIHETIYFDIEFNREGQKPKYFDEEGEKYRPDIIIHNRKSESEKKNILIIECKKEGSASQCKIDDDKIKIQRFMQHEKYLYEYGLQVIYGNPNKAIFFYKDAQGNIVLEDL